MKTFNRNRIFIRLFMLLFAIQGVTFGQNDYNTAYGKLKDSKTGEKITYATISVPGTNIGTVSNSDGEFILKVNKSLHAEFFEVSHLGYETAKFRISEATDKERIFFLVARPIQLTEVAIIPKDARGIVETALQKIKLNYSVTPNMMRGFYRESIRQRRDYISVSEAVVDIVKAPYSGFQNDKVRIFKGRKGSNIKKADTLVVKLQGGPNVSLLLDIVKNTNLSIALDNLDNYKFEYSTVVYIDNKLNWVISFSPAVVREQPLYFGKLFISQDNMAIMRAEFSLDLSNADKASSMFIEKKPAGLIFMPTSTSYLVTYKEQNGKFYLNYVRADLKFRCDWKKRLFRNYYTVMSELAVTDRNEDNLMRFTSQELFRENMIFTEKVQDLTDTEFWGENNIIEPDNSIENAIKKISKKMMKEVK
ncbi:MAG: carboxypeptidase-like regulatory domain-containing protein [Bacteroidota bacterium]|nr:carboxypeptidase-like regulatory domain-containing protein [Bacteroidota bacterium]